MSLQSRRMLRSREMQASDAPGSEASRWRELDRTYWT